jgi:hypothetical protein
MKQWKFTVKNGKELRKAVHEENGVAVINALKKCYEEILYNYIFDDETDEEKFRESYDLLDGDYEIIENCNNGTESIFNFGFDSTDELVDERLTEFYDLCDEYGFWVEV